MVSFFTSIPFKHNNMYSSGCTECKVPIAGMLTWYTCSEHLHIVVVLIPF